MSQGAAASSYVEERIAESAHFPTSGTNLVPRTLVEPKFKGCFSPARDLTDCRGILPLEKHQ